MGRVPGLEDLGGFFRAVFLGWWGGQAVREVEA